MPKIYYEIIVLEDGETWSSGPATAMLVTKAQLDELCEGAEPNDLDIPESLCRAVSFADAEDCKNGIYYLESELEMYEK